VSKTSEIEKERKAREEIIEKISPPLDPVSVSAGDRGPVVGVHSKVLAPSPFISFGCLSYSFTKVLRKVSVGVWGGLGGLTVPPPQRQMLNFLAYVT